MFFSFFKTVSSVGATPTSVLVAALPVCAYAAASVAMKCRPAGQEVGGHWFGSSRSGIRKPAGFSLSSLPESEFHSGASEDHCSMHSSERKLCHTSN
ncbi:hypothetical protein DUNSADRAFT_10230 [Dunaliella salina]|nr:hypothetical protein DUNSADRAFT_10230 [Dunaliella salina]|eukprot:KAF5825422.1 hypothetical protein DUNSADRAFT_10230 [Dunaliella salina]